MGIWSFIDGLNLFARNTQPDRAVDLLHMEVVNQDLAGIVAGTIVYNNYFIKLVVQLQQGFYVVQNRNALIMGGHQDRDRKIKIVFQLIFNGAHPVQFIKPPSSYCHR